MMNTVQYNFLKLSFLFTLTAVLTRTVCAVGGYPDMQVSGPTDQFPKEFAAFNPPVDADYVIPDGAPQIAEWIRANQPGDTLALTGENFSLKAAGEEGGKTCFTVYAGDESLIDASILRLDGRLCSIMLPETLPKNDMYLMWPCNAEGYGRPVAINKAELWWVGFDKVVAGDYFSVYGRNVSLGGGKSYLFVENYGWIESVSANPFKATFVVPEELEEGSRRIWLHNGHGRAFGWSAEASIEVEPAKEWSSKIFNVIDFGADGGDSFSDSEAIGKALSAAEKVPGSTVYFPEGIYLVDSVVECRSDKIVCGDGMGKSVIRSAGAFPAWKPVLAAKDNAVIRDLTIECTAVLDGADAVTVGGSGTSFLRVEFSALRDEERRSILDITGSIYTTITECRFIQVNDVNLTGATQARFRGCTFLGTEDCNQMVTLKGSQYIDFSECFAGNYDETDASGSFGWCKGRWLTGAGPSKDCYFGLNQTENMLPRQSTPYVEGISPSYIGAYEKVDDRLGQQIWRFDNLPEVANGRKGRLHITESPDGDLLRSYEIKERIDTSTGELILAVEDWVSKKPSDLNCKVELRDTVDQNSGEQIMFEGLVTRFRGNPVEVSDYKVRFDRLSVSNGPRMVSVVQGKGVGQSRRIMSLDETTGEVILEEPWNVIPDTESVLTVGNYLSRVVVYGNALDGRPYGATTDKTASTGAQAYGGASDFIVYGNVFTELESGFNNFGYGSFEFDGIHSTVAPNYFNVFESNLVETCFFGAPNSLYCPKSNLPIQGGDIGVLGNLWRRNIFSNIVSTVFRSGSTFSDPSIHLNIYDGNVAVNCGAFLAQGQGNRSSVIVNNRSVHQNVEEGEINIEVDNVPVLYGNQWSSLVPYENLVVKRSVLVVPHRVILINESAKNFNIFNAGSAELSWSAISQAGWISLEAARGVLSAEEDAQVNFEIVNVPEEGTEAQIKLQSEDGETIIITLIYEPETTILTDSITYPLRGFEGKLIRASVWDEVAEEWEILWAKKSPVELQIDHLVNGRWYKVLLEEYEEKTGMWKKAHAEFWFCPRK
ncbi:glycosyl hydrolase family 28-related protein [Pontiella agarivorans]|uniref:Glycosyl hydrolase family 28-related protein n=1 Tax=Pontiella agarivorans TaxID=3038953 RepID=A0ABU5MUC2_9BACT|nr:glycosyl hydrolase family 28-related protein [Pontiella agarivorans]MDZ8117757.1 glycosyl hydrolase family 28-related protein [Pontiella agarivorans]